MSGAVLLLVFCKMRLLTFISLVNFIDSGVKPSVLYMLEENLEFIIWLIAFILICLDICFSKLEKYIIAYVITALVLVCWFNSFTITLFTVLNVLVFLIDPPIVDRK